MDSNIVMIFRDSTTKWDGQIGEIDVRSGKFRRITNDLNAYSGQSLAVTRDAKELVAIQTIPETGLYVMSSEPQLPPRNPQAIDTHGDVAVGWLKGGRLLALDFDGHISTMNADGSDRNVVFQTDLPILACRCVRTASTRCSSRPPSRPRESTSIAWMLPEEGPRADRRQI